MNVPGLVVAAAAVALYTTGVYGVQLAARTPRAERGLLLWCFALQLPMSALAFIALRGPLDALVRAALGADHPLYPWVALLYAPLTEEPAKLLPLLLPFVARGVTRANVGRVARALGVGFGVGEALFVAHLVLKDPRVAPLPWPAFIPFMRERFQVALVHALLVALSLRGMTAVPRRRYAWVAAAMAAHLALNLPVLLARRGWLGDAVQSTAMLTAWVSLWWVAAMVTLPGLDAPTQHKAS
jgi:hypothetical protein